MSIDVSISAVIRCPPRDVAAYLMEPRHDPEWIGGLVEVDPPQIPLGPGVRVARVARFMGRRIDYVLEVKRLEPERLLEMRSVEAPFPMDVTYRIDGDALQSRVTLGVAGGPGGVMRLLHPLMSWQVRRNLKADLRRLRARLEMGASDSGAG